MEHVYRGGNGAMMLGDSDISDGELDFENEDRQQASKQRETEAVILRVLETQLAGRMSKILEQQAVEAIERVTGMASFSSGVVSPTSSSMTNNKVRVNEMGENRRLEGNLKTACAMLEEFDPEDPDCNIDRWLSMIDQLGDIHGWSEYERCYIMQMKLKGAAKMWFKQRDDFQLSWAEWKTSLNKAFPRQHDFAVCLEQLVERHKMRDESVSSYFHSKLELCERVGIVGEQAVSCIIRGLPEELRANAYTYRCETPEALYTQLLEELENCRVPRTEETIRKDEFYSAKRNSSPVETVTKRQVTESARHVRCYNCQEYGTHKSRNCPKPKNDRCSYCSKVGHFFRKCPKRLKRRREPMDRGKY